MKNRERERWWVPDVIDLHVYGGALLIAVGAWLWDPAAGPFTLGAILLVLGLRRG